MCRPLGGSPTRLGPALDMEEENENGIPRLRGTAFDHAPWNVCLVTKTFYLFGGGIWEVGEERILKTRSYLDKRKQMINE